MYPLTSIHPRNIRSLAIAGLVVASVAAAPVSAANAATVARNQVAPPGVSYLFYLAGAGEDNELVITQDVDGVVFEEKTVGVSSGDPDCEQLTPTKMRCSDADVGVLRVAVGGGDNKVVSYVDLATQIDGGAGLTNEFWGLGGPLELVGGPGQDVLAGGPGNDEIDGGGGNDQINGFGGDDLVKGGGGSDTMYADQSEDGADDFDGGADSDIVHYDARTTAVHVSLDDQPNDGRPGAQFVPAEEDNIRSTVESVYSGKADDTLLGSSHRDILFGGDGDDRIEGGGGNDTIVGLAGSDTMLGGEANDTVIGGGGSENIGDLADDLSGGPGDDQLHGRLGDDLLRGDEGADELTGGDGRDLVSYAGHATPVIADLDGVQFDDGSEGEGDSIGSDVEDLIGGAAGDRLTGNAAANLIRGGDGDDEIDGLAGADELRGEAGGDTLRSEDGELDSDDCGDGTDTAFADAGDARIACELPAPAGMPGMPAGTPEQPAGATPGSDPGVASTPINATRGSDPRVASTVVDGPVVRIGPSRLRLDRKGYAKLRVSCPAGVTGKCSGLLTLRRKSRTVGSARFSIAAGRTGTVRVRVLPGARRSLAPRGSLFTVRAVVRDAVSSERVVTRTVKVQRRA